MQNGAAIINCINSGYTFYTILFSGVCDSGQGVPNQANAYQIVTNETALTLLKTSPTSDYVNISIILPCAED